MTWSENYAESMKAPSIGTPEWFECIPAQHRSEAKRLVASSTPVCVVPSAKGCKVIFDGTEFLTGVFGNENDADLFAAAWNVQ